MGWLAAIKMFMGKLSKDKVSVLSAAVAFYALVSIFPALSALVSVYGLFADPSVVRTQLNSLQGVVPGEALSLLSRWLDTLLRQSRSSFGVGLLVSVAASVFLARSATGTMMAALNIAFEIEDDRGLIHYNIVAFMITAFLVLLGIVGIVLIAVLPVIVGYLPLPSILASTAFASSMAGTSHRDDNCNHDPLSVWPCRRTTSRTVDCHRRSTCNNDLGQRIGRVFYICRSVRELRQNLRVDRSGRRATFVVVVWRLRRAGWCRVERAPSRDQS